MTLYRYGSSDMFGAVAALAPLALLCAAAQQPRPYESLPSSPLSLPLSMINGECQGEQCEGLLVESCCREKKRVMKKWAKEEGRWWWIKEGKVHPLLLRSIFKNPSVEVTHDFSPPPLRFSTNPTT